MADPSTTDDSRPTDLGSLDPLDPTQFTLSGVDRLARILGGLLSVSWLLTAQAAPDAARVGLFTALGQVSMLEAARLLAPGLAGLGLLALSFLRRPTLQWKAIAILVGVLLPVLLGQNPFTVFRAVVPPLDGDLMVDIIGAVEGRYFPREDVLHRALFAAGMLLLALGARVRTVRVASPLGARLLLAGAVLFGAYYVVPYSGAPVMRVAALQNVETTKRFYTFADDLVAKGRELEKELETSEARPGAKAWLKREARALEQASPLRLTSVYFAVIYFTPALLTLLSLLLVRRARYQGDGVGLSRLLGFCAMSYLLAFLLPLVLKAGLQGEIPGLGPLLREYLVLAGLVVGLPLAGAFLLEDVVSAEADEALPPDPVAAAMD